MISKFPICIYDNGIIRNVYPTRIYIEDLSNPSPLAKIDCIKGMNIGEFSWILPIEWNRIRQVQRKCLEQCIYELDSVLGYKVFIILCGCCLRKPINKRIELLAKRYPIKSFLINTTITKTHSTDWEVFLSSGSFFEKETDIYYAQWWKIPLKEHFIEHFISALNNNKETFGFASPKQHLSEGKDDTSNLLFPMLLKNDCFGTAFSTEQYKFIARSSILRFGIDIIEDGNIINYPSISTFVQGRTDIIKCLSDKNTFLVQ